MPRPPIRDDLAESRGPDDRADWRPAFLVALGQTCNVASACRAARVSRRTAYYHREKFPKFRGAWDDAIDEAVDVLEGEARRRAVEGTDRPVFYKGKQVGAIREYSDKLLIFLLKANRPEKYRDNFDLKRLVDEVNLSRPVR
jgi:hypothetical protein